jgi:hypothetical protein
MTLVTGLAVVVGGCASKPTMFDEVASDLSPNTRGAIERPIDIDAHLAYMKDMNYRSAWDDLGRIFYTDHPSRLSPFPITYGSGQPR